MSKGDEKASTENLLKGNREVLNGDGETSKSDGKALKAQKSVKSDVDAIKFAGEALIGAAGVGCIKRYRCRNGLIFVADR